MGMFHLLCAGSGLGLVTEDVALVFVAKDGERFVPIAAPIRGNYDTYGSIDRIDFDEITKRTLAGFAKLYDKSELDIPDSDPSNPFGDDLSPEGLRGLLEHVRQGLIFEPVRKPDVASALVRVRGMSLGFVMFLAPFYDAVVAMVRGSEAGKALTKQLEKSAFGALVEASLGALSVSRALVEETSETSNALVDFALFRSWFDTRGSWSAPYVCAQYSKKELRAMVRTAKANLARWPELLEAVAAYERDSLRLAGG